jgi:hypothetical protein
VGLETHRRSSTIKMLCLAKLKSALFAEWIVRTTRRGEAHQETVHNVLLGRVKRPGGLLTGSGNIIIAANRHPAPDRAERAP